jgi:hypothetical protein
MWEYIRLKVKNAILQGVNDAMTELHNSDAHEAEMVVTLQLAAYQPASLPRPTRKNPTDEARRVETRVDGSNHANPIPVG